MNSLSNTVTRQRRDCDLNPGPSAPESSTLTIRLPSHSTIPHNKSESVCLFLSFFARAPDQFLADLDQIWHAASL